MYGQSAADATTLMALQTAGFPLLVALIGIVVSSWLQRRERAQAAFLTLSTLLAAGFWLAAGWVRGRFGVPPQQAMDLLVLAPLLLVLGEQLQRRLVLPRLFSAALVAALLSWFIWPILARGEPLVGLLGVALPVLGYLLVAALADRSEQHAHWVIWPAAAGLVAPLIALDGSLLLAQLAGILATLFGVCWLLSRWLVTLPLPALLPGGAVTLLYAAAYHYAGTTLWALLLPLGSMLLATLLLRRVLPSSGWLASLGIIVVGVAATAVVAWLIWPTQPMY